jgi:transcription factor IIIB 90 kDa subunit
MSSSAPIVQPRSKRRLPSIRHPETLVRPSRQSTPKSTTSTPQQARQAVPGRGARKCPGCKTPDVREDGGQLICFSCGTIISESVIVNDVTFGEAPSGAALVQGTTVHDGQRYAKPSGTTFRRGGRTAEDAAETISRAGKFVASHHAKHALTSAIAKEEMTRLANTLYISNMVDAAFRLFEMVRCHQFHRPLLESVAICLYVVCRQKPGNTTLLIDFAEKIRVSELPLVNLTFLMALAEKRI